MRKALKFALTVAVAACFSMPLALLAQNQVTVGSLGGRSVNAAGRGVSGERVELLNGTQVVSTTTTNGLGEWSFKDVQPGVYVVRMNVRGRIAGVRVTVEAGQVVAGTMIVVPAATSLQLGSLANFLTLIPAGAATTASTVAATIAEVETTELSPALLIEILQDLPQAERQAFAAAVVAAIQTNQSNPDTAQAAAPFTQYVQQFQNIVNSPTGAVPPPTAFQPPVGVS